MTNITVITGTRNAGKTTLIREVAKLMPDAIGVISEKCFDAYDNVSGYDAVLMPSGLRLPLCRRYSDAQFSKKHGGYWFDESVFARVDAYIHSLYDGHRPVIIDEIGSLEIKYHQGYFPTLVSLMQSPDLILIISLRS